MSPTRVLLGMLLGAAGGVLSGILDTVFHLTTDLGPGSTVQTAGWKFYLLGAIVGLCIGAGLGIVDGIYSGSSRRFWRFLAAGLVGGAVCGYIGFGIGGILYQALGGDPGAQRTVGGQLQQVVARTLGWGAMGPFVGAVGGLPSLSTARLRNGAIGGLIGGLVGGFVFQTLASANLFHGWQLRPIGFGLLGASIGFFVGLVGEVMKQAWVKVLVGRNEGREHVIDGAIAVIGRNELADIPVFLDPAMAPRQASIRFQNGRYHLFDEAGRHDTKWRGQVVANGQPLTDGDLIQIGKVTLVFYEKATATAASRQLAAAPAPGPTSWVPPVPQSGGGVCEFCGTPRDPATGACACSPASAPAPGYGAGGDAATMYAPQGYGQPTGQAGYDANPFASYGGGTDYDPTVAVNSMDVGAGGGWSAGPRLVGLSGPYAGMQIPMTAAVLTIGREAGSDITLVGDSTASRRHAAIYNQDGYLVIRDEGSSNGTFVNGMRVGEQVLQPGDEVRVGGSAFRFDP